MGSLLVSKSLFMCVPLHLEGGALSYIEKFLQDASFELSLQSMEYLNSV